VLLSVSMEAPPPASSFSFTDQQVVTALKAAARRGLTETRQGSGDLFEWGWDLQSVAEQIKDSPDDVLLDELDGNHEVSDNYPDFFEYVAVLKWDVEAQKYSGDFYVKIALGLPDLKTGGELMSFHPWGWTRR
jgi:hypothetical protein